MSDNDLPNEIPHGIPERLRSFRRLLSNMDEEVLVAMWHVITERLSECAGTDGMTRHLASTFKTTALQEALRLRAVTPLDGDDNCGVTCMGCGGRYATSVSYFEAGKCQCPTCGSSKAQRCP